VQAHVDELESAVRDADVFVCGSRDMVSEVSDRLRQLGVAEERLLIESY
jgi:ferredoxin-NADP reductase